MGGICLLRVFRRCRYEFCANRRRPAGFLVPDCPRGYRRPSRSLGKRKISSELGLGFVVSLLGLVASAIWDLPTGATVVATFVYPWRPSLPASACESLFKRLEQRPERAHRCRYCCSRRDRAGWTLARYGSPDGSPLAQLAGKGSAPVQLAFLTSDERETYRDSQEEVQHRTWSKAARSSNRSSGEHARCPKRCRSALDSILRAGAKSPPVTRSCLSIFKARTTTTTLLVGHPTRLDRSWRRSHSSSRETVSLRAAAEIGAFAQNIALRRSRRASLFEP